MLNQDDFQKTHNKGNQVSDCPSCGNSVNVGAKPRMGQLVTCRSCKTELEVVWLEPVELDWPYVDELYDDGDEDYDYDDEDDDFDFDEDDEY
jgi:alpha-aminoadipate carrier protein LysW